jgi:hypothetical protein
LDRLGFVWDAREEKKKMQLKIDLATFRVFKELNGHVDVPADFVVPCTDAWPKEAWNTSLGSIAHRIKSCMLYTDHRSQQKFLELGFIIDPTASRDVAFRQIYDSLVIYKSIYKDLLVPRGFVVPKTIEWPEELHGLRLGIRVGSIRAGESYFNLQYAGTLDSLGFIYDVNEYKFELFL